MWLSHQGSPKACTAPQTLARNLLDPKSAKMCAGMEEVIKVLFEEKEKPYIRHPFAPKGSARQGWNDVEWGRGGGGGRRGGFQDGGPGRRGPRLRQGEQSETGRPFRPFDILRGGSGGGRWGSD